MCEPLTILGISASLAGAGFKAWGAYSAGEDAAAQAERNARLAEQAARDAVLRGDEAMQAIRRSEAQVIGEQRAAIGASGIALDSGTAAELQADSRRAADADAMQARLNAAREAFGLTTQATQLRAGGAAAKAQARYAMAGTVLGGLAQAGSSGAGAWLQLQRSR